MSRGSRHQEDTSVVVSLVDTGKSTIKMLVELWYALWHESHH
jgi:hypothetical protein